MSTYKGFITLHDQVCQSSQILTWITTYNDLSVPLDVTNMHHGTHYSKVITFYSSCYNEPLKHLVMSDIHVVLFSTDSFTFTVQIVHCSWWPFVTLTSDDLRWPFTYMKQHLYEHLYENKHLYENNSLNYESTYQEWHIIHPNLYV